MSRLQSFTPVASPFASIPPHLVMEIADLEDLVRPAAPKGAVAAMLTAKPDWLPCNEQMAVQLGHAQHALRLLDDQRALVTGVQIHADIVLIDLARAPTNGKALWPHVDTERGRVMVTADLVDADQCVLLRWPLGTVGQ